MTPHFPFNGLGMSLGNLSHLSNAQTRSISAENFTGAKGQGGMALQGTGVKSARDLGQGWKISPSIEIGPHSTFTLANIAGPGAIQHVWMTTAANQWRRLILRAYWDNEAFPSPPRLSAGAATDAICPCKMTSPRPPSGTSKNHIPPIQPSLKLMF